MEENDKNETSCETLLGVIQSTDEDSELNSVVTGFETGVDLFSWGGGGGSVS